MAYALPAAPVLAATLVRPLVGSHLGGDPALVLRLSEDRRRSAQAGFDHHLTKPLDFEQLQQRLTLAD